MSSMLPTSPLRELVVLQNAKAFALKDSARPYVGLERLASGEPRMLGTLPSAESVSVNSLFEPGDILFGKLRPNLRKCVSAPFAGYCSTDILVLRARPGIDARFAGHALQTDRVFGAAVRSAIGTKMPRTNWRALQALEVFAPKDEVEQSGIAEILDTVDAAIRETEAVVAKLRQVKAGLLHDLLTRGLDARGHLRDPARQPEQFRDSPLGRIPKDWTWKRLAEFASVSSGVTLGRELGGAGTVELPYLRVANVQDGYLDLSEIKTVKVLRSEVPAFRLQGGDVLMNEGGDFDKLGRGTLWRGEIDPCLHQNHRTTFSRSVRTRVWSCRLSWRWFPVLTSGSVTS